MAAKKKIDFEKSLADLEALVVAMEKGHLSLDESLKAFEEGVRLSRECQNALQEAEQKVEILLAKGESAPFNPDDAAPSQSPFAGKAP
jgi:exodeoxyribonuclease VII small subunit